MTARLGFGMMRLPLSGDGGRRVDADAFRAMADRFLAGGGRYFDTAYYYHDGDSERAARTALSSRLPRGSFELADKLPLKLIRDERDPGVQERIFREQLGRCGVDRFDTYLIHNACGAFLEGAERLGSFDFVRGLRDDGRAGRVGFSVHDSAGYVGRLLDRYEPDVVQLQVNYLDWDSPIIQSGRCLEEARSRGIPVVVMEPARGGALADPPEEARRVLERVDPGASPASWAIRFAIGLDGVETVLSGMSDMGQLEDNLAAAAAGPLDGEELEALDRVRAIISSEHAVPCTGCRYCTDACPAGIPIPDIFSVYNSAMRAPAGGLQPQRFYYANLTKGGGRASDCLRCGCCETECPQHLEIRRLLGDAAGLLEKF